MSTEPRGTFSLPSLNKHSNSPKVQRWIWHMELGFLVTLSLPWPFALSKQQIGGNEAKEGNTKSWP